MATRMAQYSLSPPARLVQTRTCVSRDGNVSVLGGGLLSHSFVHGMGLWKSIWRGWRNGAKGCVPLQCTWLVRRGSSPLAVQAHLVGRPMLDQADGYSVSMSVFFFSLSFLRTNSKIVCMMSYHQERRNNPIHEYTEPNLDPDFPLSEDMMQRFKSNLAEDRVHHHKQSNCYRKSKSNVIRQPLFSRKSHNKNGTLTNWNRHLYKLSLLKRWARLFHKVAEDNPNCHREKDPESQESVQPTEAFDGGALR